MNWDAFFTLHRDLPREGPGTADDVRWVLDTAGITGPVTVLDAACGPGADTETLADALPDAQIHGIEKTPHFVTEAQARTARFGPRVRITEGDMANPQGGPFDFICSAGAVYFLGITEALTAWRSHLRPGGAVAFSEPCLFQTPASDDALAFWEGYPTTDATGIADRVTAAGYRTIATRKVSDQGWEDYFQGVEIRAKALEPDADPDLADIIAQARKEAADWRRLKDQTGYLLTIARPA
ncbi:class I SAM-dependent methyltransferase [Aestuariibius sp. 2305UL40-4]|uniref:class I SAM-dependent methyltransferase n=1 Tax=Aestuariibius violaceus TaxID=3234132 RepID=UPI00345E4FCA